MKDRAKAARTGIRVKARKPRKFGRMKVQPISVLRRACFRLPRLWTAGAAWLCSGLL